MSFTSIITENGIKSPTFDDRKKEIDNDMLGRGVTIIANSNDDAFSDFLAGYMVWNDNELSKIAEGHNPLAAKQAALDKLVSFKAMSRIKPDYAIGSATLTMKANNGAFNFADGVLKLSTENGIHFKNSGAFTLNASTSTITIRIISEETGTKNNLIAGQLKVISNDPSGEIESFTHTATVGGLDLENDIALRKRFVEKDLNPISMHRLIKELDRLSWVKYSRVFFNGTDEVSASGVQVGHTAIIIDDGTAGNTFTDEEKIQVWKIIYVNSWIEKFHRADNEIPLTYEQDGYSATFYVYRPIRTFIELNIDIQKIGTPVTTNLKSDIVTGLSNIFEGLEVGMKLTSVVIENELEKLDFFSSDLKNVDLKIRLKKDGVALADAWASDYDVIMPFNAKPKVEAGGLLVKVNGSVI